MLSHPPNHQGVGVLLGGMKRGLTLGSVALRRRLLVSLEIHNRDRAYDWFLTWMAHQSQAQLTSRTQRWLKSHQLSLVTATQNESNGNSGVSFNLVAGPGIHWFRYQGAWMQVRETLSREIPGER
jgi:chaperone BCS1